MRKKIIILICITILACLVMGFSACNKVKGLISPENITYDGATIKWDKVLIADNYTVSINGGDEKRASTNAFAYDAQGMDFDVKITAHTGDSSIDSTKHFTALATIAEINVSDNGVVSWNMINGASGYKIMLNGAVSDIIINSTEYTAPVGNNKFRVKAIVENDPSYFSSWSTEKQINVLASPAKLTYDGTTVKWTSVSGASSYSLEINGIAQTVLGASYDYVAGGADVKFVVKAIGNHNQTFDSAPIDSQYYYLMPVTNLQVTDGILTWDPCENATGYKIKINNVIQGKSLTEAKYTSLVEGKATSISIIPEKTDGNFFSEWSVEKEVYILKAPVISWNNDLALDGDSNDSLLWQSVDSADGYSVKVVFGGEESLSSFSSAQRAFGYAYSEVGTYTVSVKALAQKGSNYYDSKYSIETEVIRLPAPTPAATNFIVSDSSDITAGLTIAYNIVAGASGYELYGESGKIDNTRTSKSQIRVNSIIDKTTKDRQEINYSVCSLGSNFASSATKNKVVLGCLTSAGLGVKITVLSMPDALDISGFTATWGRVDDAEGYTVNTDSTLRYSSTAELDIQTLEPGTYSMKVCSKGNGRDVLPSNYTAPITINRLTAPTNIRITTDSANGHLAYDYAMDIDGFDVYLDLQQEALDEANWDNMYDYIQTTGTEIHMYASANKWNSEKTIYYMTSPSSETKQFVRLAAPTFPENAFASETSIQWNASGNINPSEYTPTYQVYLVGVGEQPLSNGTSYAISHLEGGKEYSFYVKAIGNGTKYLNSEASVYKTVFKLATPEMTIINNAYSWTSIVNASNYVIYIDGQKANDEVHVAGSVYNFIPLFTTVGKHKVQIFATGDGGYTTIKSNAFEFEQEVKKLEAPQISVSYALEQTNGKIVVNVTVPSINANGYTYEIAGVNIKESSQECQKTIENSGTQNCRVKANGGTIDMNNIYYIDSSFTAYSSIVLLGAPNANNVRISVDGIIKWTAVNGAFGYDYCIAFDGGAYGSETHVGSAESSQITNHTSYKQIKIKIKACGNDSDIIDSNWTEIVAYTNNN